MYHYEHPASFIVTRMAPDDALALDADHPRSAQHAQHATSKRHGLDSDTADAISHGNSHDTRHVHSATRSRHRLHARAQDIAAKLLAHGAQAHSAPNCRYARCLSACLSIWLARSIAPLAQGDLAHHRTEGARSRMTTTLSRLASSSSLRRSTRRSRARPPSSASASAFLSPLCKPRRRRCTRSRVRSLISTVRGLACCCKERERALTMAWNRCAAIAVRVDLRHAGLIPCPLDVALLNAYDVYGFLDSHNDAMMTSAHVSISIITTTTGPSRSCT